MNNNYESFREFMKYWMSMNPTPAEHKAMSALLNDLEKALPEDQLVGAMEYLTQEIRRYGYQAGRLPAHKAFDGLRNIRVGK